MPSNLISGTASTEFHSYFGRLAIGAGGLRRSRQFVRRCLAEAAQASRGTFPTVGRLRSTNSIVIGHGPSQPHQIEVVVDEPPCVIAEVLAVIDCMEFDLDEAGQRIIGRCGLEPVMGFRIDGGHRTRLTFLRHDAVFGWSV